MKKNRMYNTFHETLSMSLPSISSILELCVIKNGIVNLEDIKNYTNLGSNYIKVMPRYAQACGLITLKKYGATSFGDTVFNLDPNLRKPATLWLMHYHMSAPHGPGPNFWNCVVSNCFSIGNEINTADIINSIGGSLIGPNGKELGIRAKRDCASAILRTYAKSDGFGALGILREDVSKYSVLQPDPPPIGALAYALADYWDGVFGDRTDVSLNEITSSNSFISLFFIGQGILANMLSDMQRKGFVQVRRVAPPYTIVKLWTNKESLLERIYE